MIDHPWSVGTSCPASWSLHIGCSGMLACALCWISVVWTSEQVSEAGNVDGKFSFSLDARAACIFCRAKQHSFVDLLEPMWMPWASAQRCIRSRTIVHLIILSLGTMIRMRMFELKTSGQLRVQVILTGWYQLSEPDSKLTGTLWANTKEFDCCCWFNNCYEIQFVMRDL